MTVADRMTIKFTSVQFEWLHVEAKRLGLSVGELVRRIIDTAREPPMKAIVFAAALLAGTAAHAEMTCTTGPADHGVSTMHCTTDGDVFLRQETADLQQIQADAEAAERPAPDVQQ